MAFLETLFNMGKEFIPSAIGAAVKTIGGSGGGGSSGGGGGGGSTASAQAAAVKDAYYTDTSSERGALATFRTGQISTEAAKSGFASKPAAKVPKSDAQRALAALVSSENRQSFHTAMIQQQQAAQSGGPRNIG